MLRYLYAFIIALLFLISSPSLTKSQPTKWELVRFRIKIDSTDLFKSVDVKAHTFRSYEVNSINDSCYLDVYIKDGFDAIEKFGNDSILSEMITLEIKIGTDLYHCNIYNPLVRRNNLTYLFLGEFEKSGCYDFKIPDNCCKEILESSGVRNILLYDLTPYKKYRKRLKRVYKKK